MQAQARLAQQQEMVNLVMKQARQQGAIVTATHTEDALEASGWCGAGLVG